MKIAVIKTEQKNLSENENRNIIFRLKKENKQ